MKDSSKTGEKLTETTSSMSSGGATSTRKALKIEVERGSQTDPLLKNDFAKKPLKHKNSSGTDVKLDSQKDFPQGKVWKPLLTTDEITKEKGMGAFSNSPSPSTSASTPLPTFSNINVGVKSMITHLNKENTRWVFIPNSSPDIWTGAGYRKQGNNNGIPLTSVLPSNASNPFNPTSMENQVTPAGGTQTKKTTTYTHLPNSISPTSDWSNALTFTNKNNPQRNQLLLRALLGTIPVLINKSGDSNDQFNKDSDQKWDKTETNEGNLPGFGEVNGLYQLNKKLLAYFY